MTEPPPGPTEEWGFRFKRGRYEDAVLMVGTKGPLRLADVVVSADAIHFYCAATEDANASYWDETFAVGQWGAVISPPSMLSVWLLPLPWKPRSRSEPASLAVQVPLPGPMPINVSNDTEYFEPIRVGDRLSSIEQLVEVSPEKTTRLGTGHFVTVTAEICNQHDVLVARTTNRLFRYSPKEALE